LKSSYYSMQQDGGGWRALAMRVSTRVWLAGAGRTQRAMTLRRLLIERVRT